MRSTSIFEQAHRAYQPGAELLCLVEENADWDVGLSHGYL
jgi:hypothetical protein